ncbi:MAG: anti-sigma-K factor RskA [Parasphingorhabdus sp.]|jgi:anti-sigma-K factor RskA
MNETLDRNEVEKLFPWYVNGTLNDDERQQVEDHLQANPEAVTQVDFLRKVRESVKQEDVGSPGEFGLRSLQRQIKAQKQTVTKVPTSQKGWKMAAAVAGLVVMIQGSILFENYQQPDQYTPLSVSADIPLVQVIFQETATEVQIRSLLQTVGASIASGPGALGIYRLKLDFYQSTDDINKALDELRAAENVVSEASAD